MFSSIKNLRTITLEEAKVAVLPTDDYFTKENWENYVKVRRYFKISLVFPLLLVLITFLIYWVNTHGISGSGINGGAYLKHPNLFYIFILHLILFVFLMVIMAIHYRGYSKVDKNYSATFQKKNYYLVRNFSIYLIEYGFSFFLTLNLLTVGAPKLNVVASVVSYFVLLIFYIVLNLLLILPNFSAEVGKINPNFQKSLLQKFTGNLLAFLLSYALVFYIVYKFIWSLIPNAVHNVGDSSMSATIMTAGIPLIFSVFPIYSMKEKIVKGYLVNKYYNDFKKDDNYKEALEMWKPEPSANANAKREF